MTFYTSSRGQFHEKGYSEKNKEKILLMLMVERALYSKTLCHHNHTVVIMFIIIVSIFIGYKYTIWEFGV